MEHQAGAGWTGPAGEHRRDSRDSESNGRERAVADPADDTGTAPAVAGPVGGAGSAGSDQGNIPAGSLGTGPAASEAPVAPQPPATGEPRVDAALKLLERLPGMPVSDHPELFEQIHAQLSEVLGDLDFGPGAAGPGGG
ncbi:MAG TPA: hypothetical protein VMA73_20960 [Streptosporangiaceae bacterium]|nr:hypothetical protein [Streptosporangiaceae bacterium]